ncbi:MAG: glycosyltransferase family 2 protein [Paludibacteraceae bacterium]|nr:glycosyltransferase family 2 protein [Paludibacteraceae bacterium]
MNISLQIDILLSTYNGENFLREQIDSILAQTCTSWKLFIRDDASKDSTQLIIQEYVERYPGKIVWINKNEVQNVGVIKSFGLLLAQSKAPYFMFCDQDDVWLPHKIEQTLFAMQQAEKEMDGMSVPLLVHTDLQVVDKELNQQHASFFEMLHFEPEKTHSNIHFALIYNCVTGCTVMGNTKARMACLPICDWAEMHDSWVTRQVLLHGGKVITLRQATMLYRQHGNNVLGSNNSLSLYRRILHIFTVYKQYKRLLPNKKCFSLIRFLYWRNQYKNMLR